MDNNNNWRPAQAGGAGVAAVSIASGDPNNNNNNNMVDGADWQLQPDSRQRIVNKIMDTLKRHLPISGPDGLVELKKIAVRFEEKMYTAATSQSDYLRKISLKMLTMETKSQNTGGANSIPQNPVASNQNLPDPEENSKRPRLFEGESNGEKTDRISTLPDDILNSILSVLPTKYAVATSILSTRWKYLWTSVHSLDFCEYLRGFTMTTSTSYMERHNGFIDFVDRVMQLNNAPYIHKFSFDCFECDSAHFNKWISTLLQLEVQELILQIPNPPSCMFPHCFFNSDSLRVLILKMNGSMKIPSSICFSRLKVLHFINIKFSFDQPMQEISFSFPLLEECVLHECRWYKTKTINISSPKLRILTIVDEKDGVSCCKIMIYAESLISLKLESYLAYEYTLCNLLSLVDASIDVTSENTPQRSRVGSLFRGLANVRNLELPGNVIKTLSLPKVLDHVLTLSCLIHLKVVCSEYGLSATTGGRELAHVLNKMPNIQSLSFPEGLDLFNDEKRGSKIKVVSPCFLPHLKSIDIRHFSWKEKENQFIIFLMRYLRGMDKMTIKLTICGHNKRPCSLERKEKVTKQLRTIACVWNCVIEFA